MFPKVLLCAPQHDSKNYCWKEWITRAKELTYPNYDIFIADNSDTMDNYNELLSQGVKAEHITKNKQGLLFTINDAHNSCRDYVLNNDYEYMFHLETDIIPPMDVIERLMNHKRKVCMGLYDIFYGKRRKAMIQMDEKYDRSVRAFRTSEFIEESEPLFFDGTVKKVFHAGIGCALIHRSVIESIPFRVEKGNNSHSDTYFAFDCFQHNIPIYVDTELQCKHLNFTWLNVIDELI